MFLGLASNKQLDLFVKTHTHTCMHAHTHICTHTHVQAHTICNDDQYIIMLFFVFLSLTFLLRNSGYL